jgi:hypothetical protein
LSGRPLDVSAAEPSIRRCAPADAAALAELGARLFAQAYAATHPEPELGRYLARSFDATRLGAELSEPDVAIFVAEDGSGRPVGYAYLRATAGVPPAGVPGGHACEIVRFYVTPIGTAAA